MTVGGNEGTKRDIKKTKSPRRPHTTISFGRLGTGSWAGGKKLLNFRRESGTIFVTTGDNGGNLLEEDESYSTAPLL